MTERAKLLEVLSAADFACWETHLFLDTHPDCEAALAAEKEYAEKADMLRDEFEQRFGSLTGKACDSGERWAWVNDPWPWDAQ